MIQDDDDDDDYDDDDDNAGDDDDDGIFAFLYSNAMMIDRLSDINILYQRNGMSSKHT